MSRLVATVAYVGLLRPAPGTWGSLAALPMAWALLTLGGPVALGLAILSVTVLGYWAARAEIAATGDDDPAHVVIDEVAGQWLALMPVGLGAAWAAVPPEALWPGWLAAFGLFRLFDIWKPGWVGRADARGDALGLMADDLIAGAFAALGTAALAVAAHAVMRLT